MELDYREAMRVELTSLKERLIVLDTFMPATNAGELAEKVNVCLDYLFYLEDTSLPVEGDSLSTNTMGSI